MSRVLVVEDSRTFSSLLSRRITEEMGHQVVVANSMAKAEAILAMDTDFFVALLDLNLPDAPTGQVVDLVLARNIPSIVFTGELDDELRDQFWAKRIVDYILKQNMDNVAYMLSLVERLHRNPAIKVLVVDDSQNARFVVGELLRAHRYQVLEAEDGLAALAVLAEHPDMRLVITDYNMPNMDGFELVRSIRRDHAKDQMGIIGISGADKVGLSARFIKSGANDFLHKPFLTEEFYTRVTQNIELLEYIAQIKDLAEKDYLTRLYNRRYMFAAGPKLMAAQTRRGQGVVLAMLDIDHFKRINDTFGHDAGDAVLRQMSALLTARFRTSDIVARFGGEEFCVLATDMNPADAGRVFEDLRQSFESSPVSFGGQSIPYTVSIGLCTSALEGLEAMIKAADDALYVSKNDGRNRVTLAGR
ncbi:MAG: diguanylate cyclase [Humidesulfovibrio sp.]|uniref:diguanylate cyclase n=1 Tax=Humidesulfovibrio sp. TaxID=2910988 RepID=UPI0027F2969E|nr:diguanylate cyclase [Humidesulfovibrio sp.]MDQ7834959.1 diguanylate cyclase [Humidesulfovibrio sp.]